MPHRGAEQRGADGLGVITAQDEKERKGDNERRREEGRRGSQMGDKISEGYKDKETYLTSSSLMPCLFYRVCFQHLF